MKASGIEIMKCVVCGTGKTGLSIIEELVRHGVAITAVDTDQNALNAACALGESVTGIQGNCLSDKVLKQAGLDAADVLFCVLPDDRGNVFLCLSASKMNPGLEIYSVASDVSAEEKLRLVGTRRTVNRDTAEGLRISNEMIRPNVARFIDGIVYARESTEGYICIEISEDCPSIGGTLRKLGLRAETGVVIVAVRKKDGGYVYSPSGEHRLEEGQGLVFFGSPSERDAVMQLLWKVKPSDGRWQALKALFNKRIGGRGGRI